MTHDDVIDRLLRMKAVAMQSRGLKDRQPYLWKTIVGGQWRLRVAKRRIRELEDDKKRMQTRLNDAAGVMSHAEWAADKKNKRIAELERAGDAMADARSSDLDSRGFAPAMDIEHEDMTEAKAAWRKLRGGK